MSKIVIMILKWARIVLVLYGLLSWALGDYLPVGVFDDEMSSSGYYKVVVLESSYWYIVIPTVLGFILTNMDRHFTYYQDGQALYFQLLTTPIAKLLFYEQITGHNMSKVMNLVPTTCRAHAKS